VFCSDLGRWNVPEIFFSGEEKDMEKLILFGLGQMLIRKRQIRLISMELEWWREITTS
jgi:hypothetical protein